MPPSNVVRSSETTVLKSGTVENRGMGTKETARLKVEQEILDFIHGEAKLGVTAETRSFFTVWTFITRLPAPTWVDHHPGYLMRGMAYFPLAGSLVGVFCAGFFDFANATLRLPSSIAACISTAASLWITGCFHEDGLADSSDGIGGGWSRQQILTIMTDTRLGTYGCAVLLLYMVAKLELLSFLSSSDWDVPGLMTGSGPALVAAHTVARLTSPYMIRTNDYVDEVGPKYQFYSFMVQAKYLVTWHRVLFATLTCYLITSYLYDSVIALVLIGSVLTASHFAGRYGTFLLGGVMGDFLGATTCVAELLVLSLILILTNNRSVPRTWEAVWSMIEHANSTSSQDIAQWTHQFLMEENGNLGPFGRFAFIILVTTVWSSMVGHRSILVRESIGKATEKDGKKKVDAVQRTRPGYADLLEQSNARDLLECAMTKNNSISFQQRYDAVRAFVDSLAKPVGSLGTLEDWAARLAALQGRIKPNVDPVICMIFAADHGVSADKSSGGEACSSYPQSVTRSILHGLERGMAGAAVLAKQNGVVLKVIDVGVTGQRFGGRDYYNEVVSSSEQKLKNGTANFCKGPAMTTSEVEQCIQIGRHELAQFVSHTGANVVCFGEVGIGNTTTTAALIAHLVRTPVETVCGAGATKNDSDENASIEKKVKIVKKALAFHKDIGTPIDSLAKLGGAEIAALVGAILEASSRDLAILIDGYIVSAAALTAAKISPEVCRIMFFATKSAERGHSVVIDAITQIATSNSVLCPAPPALDMGLRMGEATGSILAVPILRSAATILKSMGTIDELLRNQD